MVQCEIEKNTISSLFWTIKCVAIFCVISAHILLENAGPVAYYFFHVLSNIGSMSVGLFMFCSGFYFKATGSFHEFLKTRIQTIVIPWLLAATCVWFYMIGRKAGLSFVSWFNYFIGNGSIYYYLTDLLVIQFIFWIAYRVQINRIALGLISSVLSICFIVLESRQISFFPTPYLDFFVFIGYFGVGAVASELKIVEKVLQITKNARIFVIILGLLLLFSPLSFGYFQGFFTFFFELFFIFMTVCLSSFLCGPFPVLIGKQSFFIYLWHLPVVGIVLKFFNRNALIQLLCLLWPFLILAIMLFFCALITRILKDKSHGAEILRILGISRK